MSTMKVSSGYLKWGSSCSRAIEATRVKASFMWGRDHTEEGTKSAFKE